jgi:hypothetical protein
MVALKTLFMNLLQLKYYWKVNKIEFVRKNEINFLFDSTFNRKRRNLWFLHLKFIFLISFLSVALLDVDIGLGVGVVVYILSHLVRSIQ